MPTTYGMKLKSSGSGSTMGTSKNCNGFRMDDYSTVRGEEGGDLLLRTEGNRLVRQARRGACQEEVRALRHGGIFSEEQVVAEELGLIREIARAQQRDLCRGWTKSILRTEFRLPHRQ